MYTEGGGGGGGGIFAPDQKFVLNNYMKIGKFE